MSNQDNTCTGFVTKGEYSVQVIDSLLEMYAGKIKEDNKFELGDNIIISEAKVAGINDTTPTIDEINTYDYIRIEPSYYLRYEDGKMYKNTSTDEVVIPGWRKSDAPGDDGKYSLILDGFNFTTASNKGLVLVDDVNIQLAEGSSNSIIINNTGITESIALYSSNGIVINGSGCIDVQCNFTYTGTNKKVSGLGIEGPSVTISDATVNVVCVSNGRTFGIYSNNGNTETKNCSINININSLGEQACGVYSVSKIIMNNTIMDVKLDGIRAVGVFGTNDVEISNTELDIDIVGIRDYDSGRGLETQAKLILINSDISVNMKGDKSEDASYLDGLFAKGAFSCDNCDIYINTSGYVTNDIYVKDGNIDIVNDSNITIEDESIQQVGLYMELSGHKLLTDNSTVNIKGSNSSMVVAICCSDSNMVVSNNSEIIINISGLTACGVSVNAIEKIDNSVVDIDIKKSIADSSAFGISTINDIAINNSDVYIDIIKDDSISNDEDGCAYGIAVGKGQITIIGQKDKGIDINITGGNVFGIISGYYFEIYPYNDERVGVNISSSNVNVTTNIIGTEGSMSAIKVVKGDISLTDSNVNASCSKEAENGYGYGLQVDNDKIVSIKGGSTTIKGGKMAVNAPSITLNNGDYYDTKVMKACTDFEGTDANTVVYDSANITDYKYLEIKAVDSYYYRFDGTSLYKVKKDNSVLAPLESTSMPTGLSIENNKLVLNGFNFATTAEKILDMVGETSMVVEGDNTLTSVDSNQSCYGIYANNNLNITGINTSTLKFVNKDDKYLTNTSYYYDSMFSTGNITIDGGNYIFDAIRSDFYGMYCYNSITIKGNANIDMVADISDIGYGIYSEYGNIDLLNSDVDIRIKPSKHSETTIREQAYGVYLEWIQSSKQDKYITIDGGKLFIDIEGYCTYGITTFSENISIKGGADVDVYTKMPENCKSISGYSPESCGINAKGNLEIRESSNVLVDTNNREKYSQNAIESWGNINITSSIVNVSNNGINESHAIYCKLNVTIDGNSTVNAYNNVSTVDNAGCGICVEKLLQINNSTVNAKGKTSAIGIADGGTCNVKGKVEASEDYSGTPLIEEQDFNNNYNKYKYTSIIPSVISVDISWGNMDFTYTEGSWNPISHDYNVGTWKPTDGKKDSTKITVDNANSNVPIYAEIGYASVSSDYNGIVGKIVDGEDSEIGDNVKILRGDSLAAYLDLDNKLPSTTAANTPIGQVTVTISE